MTVLVQDRLQKGEINLPALEQFYGIKSKRHGKYPNLVLLKYDQINSPMSDAMVQECRGIILDESDNWRIVARPFDKFFNSTEGHAAKIDWATARVQEKLDGSLMILYWYDNQWIVASSGTPDAAGQVGAAPVTFKDLFWQVWGERGYRVEDLDKNATYMFELCTKLNRIVVPHAENRLVLLGIRIPANGYEANPLLLKHAFEVVKHFTITSEDDLVRSFGDFDGLNQEGYVVVDAEQRRVKVKHPRYVLLHHMVGSLTTKKLLDTIRLGEMSEILSYFPEWKAEADQLSGQYAALVTEAALEYEKIKSITVQKDFALAIKDSKHKSAMFAVRSGKSTGFGDFYAHLRIESLADMLGLKVADDAAPTPEGNA